MRTEAFCPVVCFFEHVIQIVTPGYFGYSFQWTVWLPERKCCYKFCDRSSFRIRHIRSSKGDRSVLEIYGSSWKTSAINGDTATLSSALMTALVPVTWFKKRHWLQSPPFVRSCLLLSQNISMSSMTHAFLWRWNLPVIVLWISLSILSSSSRRFSGMTPLGPTPYLIVSSLLISFSDFIVCHKS